VQHRDFDDRNISRSTLDASKTSLATLARSMRRGVSTKFAEFFAPQSKGFLVRPALARSTKVNDMLAQSKATGRIRFSLAGLLFAALLLQPSMAGAAAAKKLAILQLEIEDITSASGSQPWHQESLHRLTDILGADLAKADIYEIVTQANVDAATAAFAPISALHNCNGCEIDIARKVGADRVMVAWIFKMSLLVMALHVEIKDVSTGATVYRKIFDFKGDNEESWRRASKYMVRELGETKGY